MPGNPFPSSGPSDGEVRELAAEFAATRRPLGLNVLDGGQTPNRPHINHVFRDPTAYETAILHGLQSQPHIYGGTVPAGVVADRRRKNRAARKSRRINRIARQR